MLRRVTKQFTPVSEPPVTFATFRERLAAMSVSTVVAVYGIPAGLSQPRRLGSGRLALAMLVMLDEPLQSLMEGEKPPKPLRVGLGCIRDNRPFVEVIEVLQVLETGPGEIPKQWGLELAHRSKCPSSQDGEKDDPPGAKPASVWCKLFPTASYCK